MEAFSYSKIKHNGTDIYLMTFDAFNPMEFIDRLTENEIERLMSFKHIKRRREFVATRILRHELFGFRHIMYEEHGAPYIEDEGYISISHGVRQVGIAVNSHYKIGLDLETPRDSILSVKHKFLSEYEKSIFDIDNILEMTRVWSAKEVLYKLAGRKKIHFKSELLLSIDKDQQWKGCIINSDHELLVDLNIFEHNNTIITVNSKEIVKVDRNISAVYSN